MARKFLIGGLAAVTWFTAIGAVGAADLTARQITESLYKATDAAPLDFARQNLQGLDLAGLDFKKARLGQADLFGEVYTTHFLILSFTKILQDDKLR